MGCHKCVISPEKCNKMTLALWKNLGFQLFLPKIRRPKFSGSGNFQLRSIMTLPMQLKKLNGSFKWVSRKWVSKLGNAVRNGECRTCFDNFKNFLLFWRKPAQKTFGKIYQNKPLTWMMIHRIMQIYYFFKLTVETRQKIYPLLLKKTSKLDFFSANDLRKQNWQLIIWKMIDRQSFVVFIQNSGKCDQ